MYYGCIPACPVDFGIRWTWMKERGPWIHAEAEGMRTAPTLLRTIYSRSCDMDSYFQWDSMTHTWGRKKHSAWMTYANAVKFTCWFWRCPLQDISFVILEKKMSVGLFLLGKYRQAICSNITFCFFFKINSGVVSFHYTTILYWNRKTFCVKQFLTTKSLVLGTRMRIWEPNFIRSHFTHSYYCPRWLIRSKKVVLIGDLYNLCLTFTKVISMGFLDEAEGISDLSIIVALLFHC